MILQKIPVEFSEQALAEIRNIISKKGIPSDHALRVGVRGGGCGVTRIIGFDRPREQDQEWELAGIRVIIDKGHIMHLIGCKVSFYEDEERRGFLFE